MEPLGAAMATRRPQRRAGDDPITDGDSGRRQVRVRGPYPTTVIHGDRPIVGDDADERDHPGSGGPDRGPGRDGEIHTPVPTVPPLGGEAADDGTSHRGSQTGEDDDGDDEHGTSPLRLTVPRTVPGPPRPGKGVGGLVRRLVSGRGPLVDGRWPRRVVSGRRTARAIGR